MNTWLLPIQAQLSSQVLQKRLPHALIINGSHNLGSNELPRWLAKVMLCSNVSTHQTSNVLSACQQCKACQLLQSGLHPDVMSLVLEGESHGVDEIRKLSHFLEKTAQYGGAQLAVIEDAERMTVSAANALLKTLEEPTANSFLILVTNNTESLLPTIMSRAHIINIRLSSKQVLENVGDKSLVNDFCHVSHLSFLSDEKQQQDFANFYRVFLDFVFNRANRVDVLALMQNTHFDFRWCEQVIVDLMRDSYQWLNGNKRVSGTNWDNLNNVSPTVFWRMHTILLDKLRILSEQPQANQQIIFEAFLVEIQETIALGE